MRYVIDGFEDLTPQQVFDMAARHVLANGEPSLQGAACSYAGIGCAAAPFLRPEVRDNPELRGKGWGSLCDFNIVPANNNSLISALQGCHDGAANRTGAEFIATFRGRMHSVAEEHGLSAAVLDEPHASAG